MTKRDSDLHSRGGLSRRALVHSAAALLSVPFITTASRSWAQEKLLGNGEVVVYSYGGSYTQAVRQNVYEPFTKATGIKVVDVVADFSEPQVKAMFRAGRVDWDIALVQAQNFPPMQEAGMFLPIDYSLWDEESIAGTPSRNRLKDALVAFGTTENLAYDGRAFPNDSPKNWIDFWDVKKFPGPRGLQATLGKKNIQYALLADGVAHGDIWPFTDDKLIRAFKKLDEIKPHVSKWWIAGGEGPQLLANREYAMTAAPDGRLINQIRQGAPIKFIWEGGYLNYQYATILKGGPNTANAQKLLAFLNRAQIAAAFTQATGYPGPNTNQLKYLPADLIPLLSISPENAAKVVIEDGAWLAASRPDGKTNAEHVQERWLAWRTG